MRKKILIAMDRNEPIEIESNGVIRTYLIGTGILAFAALSAWLVMEYPREMIILYGGSAIVLAGIAGRSA